MRIVEINPQKFRLPSESERSKAKEKMEKMRKDGEKMVKGMFEFIDAQGGWIDFCLRIFPGESVKVIHINHGEIVDLPMTLVKHLNNIWVKVRTPNPQMTEDGRFVGAPTITKRSRTRFTPMDVLV